MSMQKIIQQILKHWLLLVSMLFVTAWILLYYSVFNSATMGCHLDSVPNFPQQASDICFYTPGYYFISYEYNISPEYLQMIAKEKSWELSEIRIPNGIGILRYNYPDSPISRCQKSIKNNRRLSYVRINKGLYYKRAGTELKVVYDSETQRLYFFSVIHGIPGVFITSETANKSRNGDTEEEFDIRNKIYK